ncbi:MULTISPECIES: hypothetical protein [unclassified Pseudarthrobacter]|uniref:hypothetical protein n=1 Tax=unclassified Pseudarthrobacter TaxID=2647000 RepID=UPI003076E3A2
MTETAAAGQKEQAKAWDKQCNKIGLKYFAIALPPLVLLMAPFMTTLQYFLDVTGPLVSGKIASGPGFNEYRAVKDQALIILAVLLAFITAVFYFAHRWWKKSMRAIGRRPGGYPYKWKRWLSAE